MRKKRKYTRRQANPTPTAGELLAQWKAEELEKQDRAIIAKMLSTFRAAQVPAGAGLTHSFTDALGRRSGVCFWWDDMKAFLDAVERRAR